MADPGLHLCSELGGPHNYREHSSWVYSVGTDSDWVTLKVPTSDHVPKAPQLSTQVGRYLYILERKWSLHHTARAYRYDPVLIRMERGSRQGSQGPNTARNSRLVHVTARLTTFRASALAHTYQFNPYRVLKHVHEESKKTHTMGRAGCRDLLFNLCLINEIRCRHDCGSWNVNPGTPSGSQLHM